MVLGQPINYKAYTHKVVILILQLQILGKQETKTSSWHKTYDSKSIS